MNEINTFSAAVDAAITRSGRLDRRSDVISHLRLTLRECQVLAQFQKDMVEDSLTASTDPYIWTYPKTFRKLLVAAYPARIDQRGKVVYPRAFMRPGKHVEETDYYLYPSGDSIVFAGMGASNLISVVYLSYFTALQYYAEAARPARYDLETLEWEYLTTPADDDAELAAQNLVTNWLLFNWFDLCIEGTLAKLYKMVDDPRSSSTYALYKSLQTSLLEGENMLVVDNP